MSAPPETWSERLSALDASFLDMEEPTAPMHVGAVSVYEGKPPAVRELIDLISSRLDRLPRYVQRLATVPLGIGRPVWVDAPDVDLASHVRSIALPRPGGARELRRLAARLLAARLDRERPLWELWLVEGLRGGRFAVVSKTHHCMIDGVSGVDLASVLMDTDPGTTQHAGPSRRAPRPRPGGWALVADAVLDQVQRPLELAREAVSPETEGRRALLDLAGGIGPLLGIARLGPAPPSSLNRPVGKERIWEMVSIDLADVKRVRASLGGTVNDVLLAVVAGALRRLLKARKEAVPAELRVLVPVSVRAADARGTLGNQVAAVFCSLPVGERDPVARLRRVSGEMTGLKESRQALGAKALTRLGDFAPPTLAALATRLRTPGSWFNLVVTNVPGPQYPLYLLGRRLVACHPVVPLTTVTTISIALLSYDGAIHVGLLGDAEHAADLPTLARGIPAALAQLTRRATAPTSSRVG